MRFLAQLILFGFLFACLTMPVVNANLPQPEYAVRIINTLSPLPGVNIQPSRVIPNYWQQFPTGPLNAITDVSGVQVGHVTLLQNQPQVRTGITAVIPKTALSNGTLANTGFPAAASVLNGNGEMTGLYAIQHSGLLNGPIILTNTASVGIAHQGIWQYFQRFFPDQWESELPVVGECWDGFFSTMHPVLMPQDVTNAIQQSSSGPVLQGRIGAGTGMRSFELHGGIGSASRRIKLDNRDYTIGVLVNTNHSKLDDLNPLLKSALEAHWQKPLNEIREIDNHDRAKLASAQSQRQGSIIIIIATDLPLDTHALKRMTDHAALGIAQTGGKMNTTSGDFALAFSTANAVLMNDQAPTQQTVTSIHPNALTPIFQATIEAVAEAQLNALLAAHISK